MILEAAPVRRPLRWIDGAVAAKRLDLDAGLGAGPAAGGRARRRPRRPGPAPPPERAARWRRSSAERPAGRGERAVVGHRCSAPTSRSTCCCAWPGGTAIAAGPRAAAASSGCDEFVDRLDRASPAAYHAGQWALAAADPRPRARRSCATGCADDGRTSHLRAPSGGCSRYFGRPGDLSDPLDWHIQASLIAGGTGPKAAGAAGAGCSTSGSASRPRPARGWPQLRRPDCSGRSSNGCRRRRSAVMLLTSCPTRSTIRAGDRRARRGRAAGEDGRRSPRARLLDPAGPLDTQRQGAGVRARSPTCWRPTGACSSSSDGRPIDRIASRRHVLCRPCTLRPGRQADPPRSSRRGSTRCSRPAWQCRTPEAGRVSCSPQLKSPLPRLLVGPVGPRRSAAADRVRRRALVRRAAWTTRSCPTEGREQMAAASASSRRSSLRGQFDELVRGGAAAGRADQSEISGKTCSPRTRAARGSTCGGTRTAGGRERWQDYHFTYPVAIGAGCAIRSAWCCSWSRWSGRWCATPT